MAIRQGNLPTLEANSISELDRYRAASIGAFQIALPERFIRSFEDALHEIWPFFLQSDTFKRNFDSRSLHQLIGWHRPPGASIRDTSDGLDDSKSQEPVRDYETFDVSFPRSKVYESRIWNTLFSADNRWPSLDFQQSCSALFDILTTSLHPLISAIVNDLADKRVVSDNPTDVDSLRYLRFLKYPPLTSADSSTRGFYEHYDYETFTVLFAKSDGLEVLDSDGEWLRPRASEDRAVVLIGELGRILSDNRVASSLHRVRLDAARPPRKSLAYFVAPDPTLSLRPLAHSEMDGDRSTTVGDYLVARFAKSYGLA